jgi:hypothetical protein
VSGGHLKFLSHCEVEAPRKEQQHVNIFLDKLDEFSTDLGNDSILVGDFNFNLNNINASLTSMCLDLIGSHVFFICNENTTSMATQSASLIDHVMVNELNCLRETTLNKESER